MPESPPWPGSAGGRVASRRSLLRLAAVPLSLVRARAGSRAVPVCLPSLPTYLPTSLPAGTPSLFLSLPRADQRRLRDIRRGKVSGICREGAAGFAAGRCRVKMSGPHDVRHAAYQVCFNCSPESWRALRQRPVSGAGSSHRVERDGSLNCLALGVMPRARTRLETETKRVGAWRTPLSSQGEEKRSNRRPMCVSG
jgi:hypothetical protein